MYALLHSSRCITHSLHFSSRAPGPTSGFQEFMNAYCGTLLCVPQSLCISSLVFYTPQVILNDLSHFVIRKQKFITVVIYGRTSTSCFSANTWHNEMKQRFGKTSKTENAYSQIQTSKGGYDRDLQDNIWSVRQRSYRRIIMFGCQHKNKRKILMLSNATNQPKSTVELGFMCPRGLSGPPAETLTK